MAEKHLEMLNTLLTDGFFALADDGEKRTVAAIKWALAEIERLTQENDNLKIESISNSPIW